MSNVDIEIAKYQFHAWARKGIAVKINETDTLGADSSGGNKERAVVTLGVSLNDTNINKNFSLIGPGDIIGINRDMIVRTEPLNWITDFEPNYLAFAEFYDEDFCWRYTPAAPAGDDKPADDDKPEAKVKLRPWIFLLVLKEDEFEKSKRRVPLPSIIIKNKEAFPPHTETWMWAHVHSNANIPDEELSEYEKFLLSLNQIRNEDPDQLYCRLMSPRKLEADTAYYSFLIPAFETGRLAGLELSTETTPAQQSSWNADIPGDIEMPVYYEWFFRTGANVDFESLVKKLEPRPMDPKVGIRDIDCSKPGFVRAEGSGQGFPGTSPPILGLEGALKSFTTQSTVFPDPPESKDFQAELQKIVNLAVPMDADLTKDPIISVPLYGGSHAKISANDVIQLEIDSDAWVNDLNKDPRTRVPAGLGTLAIQNNQEVYMRKAWSQVTKIIEANRRIKATYFNMKVALQYTQKTFGYLQTTSLLSISKPVLSRIMGTTTTSTVFNQIRESKLPSAAISGAFRKLVRPNGKFVKKVSPTADFNSTELMLQLNEGKLVAGYQKQVPVGLPNTFDYSNKILEFKRPPVTDDSPPVVVATSITAGDITSIPKTSVTSPLIKPVDIGKTSENVNNPLSGDEGSIPTQPVFEPPVIQTDDIDVDVVSENLISPINQLGNINNIPPRPSFFLKLSDEVPATPGTVVEGTDSPEAQNFKTALIDFITRLSIEIPAKTVLPLDINVWEKVSVAIHPHYSFPVQLAATVKFPNDIDLKDPENIFPAMAYPDFEDAMYKKLNEISSELLLPNLKLIPPNTISLLKVNKRFIESYMVGLNHEMGRELLWREYPTDQRGSYFRQFWDVKGIIRPAGDTPEAELTEEYKDITPLHTWSGDSLLGTHSNRAQQHQGGPHEDTEEIVLVIRGDLLKRYPNTVIFAQKAFAGTPPIDPKINTGDDTDFEKELKFPLYKAEIEPDIKFFGFDLTPEQAKGEERTHEFNDDRGWFFVLQQIPGEPRFGMDISSDAGSDGSWDDLAWTKFPDDMKFIKASISPSINPSGIGKWGADSANMAYILFQKPSMVAIHAKEMLENLNTQ